MSDWITSKNCDSILCHIRGLSQKVVDFLCYNKTIQCIAIKFYLCTLPLFLHYHAKFEGKIFDNEVRALILPAIGLAQLRTTFVLLRTSESIQL